MAAAKSKPAREQGPVPHHRVDKQLHSRAKRKAERGHVSLSEVVRAGLEIYIADLSPQQRSAYLRRTQADGTIVLPPLSQSLPDETAATLVVMWQDRDPRLNAYLLALYEAGWSLQAIAEPVGVSRQAVHLRVKKAQEEPTTTKPSKRLPAVPRPPYRSSGPGRDGSTEKVDMAVWVDRDTYAVAARHARRHGEPMHDVMEQILRDYIAGKIQIGP